MTLTDSSYRGFYARFDSPDKSVGSLLMGPDNIVGDSFQIIFKNEEDRVVAWLKNKFDKELGYFDVDASRLLQLAHARNQEIRTILSFVAYSDEPDPGLYWGEVAIFCFNPAYSEEMNAFVDRCAQKLAEGIRPNIDLGSSAVSNIFSDENWLPSDTVPFPEKTTGMAILKRQQSLSEKMIEQGRNRNVGCYIVSWGFILFIIIMIGLGLHSLGLF